MFCFTSKILHISNLITLIDLSLTNDFALCHVHLFKINGVFAYSSTFIYFFCENYNYYKETRSTRQRQLLIK